MEKIVYQISISNPAKADKPELNGACFSSFGVAADTLRLHGFEYSEEAALYHNGSTEAWITRRPVSSVILGVEEVQFR